MERPAFRVSGFVEIAAVVVWRVVGSAKAAFAVDDHVQYS
jgi:hypothetical protein